MEAKGRVKAVKQFQDKYGVLLTDEVWYNGFGTCPVNKNDYVVIEYETKGKFHNVTSIKAIDIEEDKKVFLKEFTQLKTFAFTDSAQLDNAVNMFCKENDVIAWQPTALNCSQNLVLFVCSVTYRVRQ